MYKSKHSHSFFRTTVYSDDSHHDSTLKGKSQTSQRHDDWINSHLKHFHQSFLNVILKNLRGLRLDFLWNLYRCFDFDAHHALLIAGTFVIAISHTSFISVYRNKERCVRKTEMLVCGFKSGFKIVLLFKLLCAFIFHVQ
jgi:hypothetical protein